MLKNYLLVAIRNLRRNKVFSVINILGLAFGLACSLLIMLWVRDEKSMDAFHANGGRLYNVYENQFYDGKIESGYFTPGLLGQELKKKIPEIEMAVDRGGGNDHLSFQAGEKILKEEGNYASEDFFGMFSFPLLEGKATTALSEPASLAISRKMANQFFGSPQAAFGKTIRCEDNHDFKITAVFEDVPPNSSLKFEFVANWFYFLDHNSWAKEWGNNGPGTSILLRADAKRGLVAAKIRKFLDNYNKEQDRTFHIELGMQPVTDQYLHAEFKNGKVDGGRFEYVKLFSIVAIFVLLIACINFMNLTTARSGKRSREIGIRKVAGALRGVLTLQFLGEALLLALFGAILALLLVALLLPGFNNLTGKQITFPYNSFSFWIQILVIVLGTGLVAGSYPALFLSSFNPATVLKGTLKFSSGTTFFRKGLVVFQFALSIILIVGTIVVSKQVHYIRNKDLGFNRENLLYLPVEGELRKNYAVFRDEALRIPGILGMTRMTDPPTEMGSNTGGVEWDGKDPTIRPMFTQAAIGYDFVKTMKLTMVRGRDFSKDFGTDSLGYIVNEAALRRIGYKDPIGKRLTLWGKNGTIVGVVKDFHYTSLALPIEPLILRLGDQLSWGTLLIKTEKAKTTQVLAGLERLCKKMNPKFPFSYQFADEEFSKIYRSEQVIDKLCTWFAGLAIFICSLGLLGLAIFTAEQRTKEIGIRKVLGAGVSGLFILLSKEFFQLVLIALLLAIPISWWGMSQWLQQYNYHTALSWWVFLAAGMLALLVALATVSFQILKAANVNPVKSLRTE